ncbi:unnamed protein product, partial [Iphiclides podalirius]
MSRERETLDVYVSAISVVSVIGAQDTADCPIVPAHRVTLFTSHFFDFAARSGRNKRTSAVPRPSRPSPGRVVPGSPGECGHPGVWGPLELMKFPRPRFPQVVTCGRSFAGAHIAHVAYDRQILPGRNVLISASRRPRSRCAARTTSITASIYSKLHAIQTWRALDGRPGSRASKLTNFSRGPMSPCHGKFAPHCFPSLPSP